MNLNIEFSPEIESALAERAAAQGVDVPTFVQELVTERLAEESQPAMLRPRQLAERLDEWMALHPRTGRVIDDSRDSIYAGRE